jgi:hypothetical protein
MGQGDTMSENDGATTDGREHDLRSGLEVHHCLHGEIILASRTISYTIKHQLAKRILVTKPPTQPVGKPGS